MPEVHLIYDDLPPSLNEVATAHWRKYNRAKKQWQQVFEGLLMAENLPRPLLVVRAQALLSTPNHHGKDEGNFRFFLEKSLGDALVNGGWLLDDTCWPIDYYRFGRLDFWHSADKRTDITLSYTEV
jgi:hypothetical protein